MLLNTIIYDSKSLYLKNFLAILDRQPISPRFKNRAAARRKNMESDFFEGGGFSCRILYRMNGLESAMRFLLNLLQESMPVERINIMCAATDLSVFVPISDTNAEKMDVIHRMPGRTAPLIEPERLSEPLLVGNLAQYKERLCRDMPDCRLPFFEHTSLLRLPLFRRGVYVFLINFWSNRRNAFTHENIKQLRKLIQPMNAELQDKFSHIESVAVPLSESGTGYEGLKRCDGLAAVREAVARVAPTESTVLITGETGAGKEGVAEAVHELSPRSKGPFVRVNCGAIAENLVDSELFGHEKGAFTGAHATRVGYFELAAGGTLFLDEVGELPLSAQVKLLRVLDSRTIMRVGNPRQISVDLRFVAATNRDLERMVDEGSFRRDLYYRLAVYPISVPPLRQRRTDIKTLTEYFISTKTKKMKLHLPPKLSHDEEDRLYLYHWPGNVRELEHVVERALINSRSGSTAGELHFDLPESGSRKHSPIEPFQGWPTLEELNSRYIDAVLEKTGGRLTGPKGAAALLGIHYTTLRAHLKRRSVSGQP